MWHLQIHHSHKVHELSLLTHETTISILEIHHIFQAWIFKVKNQSKWIKYNSWRQVVRKVETTSIEWPACDNKIHVLEIATGPCGGYLYARIRDPLTTTLVLPAPVEQLASINVTTLIKPTPSKLWIIHFYYTIKCFLKKTLHSANFSI